MSEPTGRARTRVAQWRLGAAAALGALGCAPPPVNIAAYALDRGHCGDFAREVERFWTPESRVAVASGILSVGNWAEMTKTTVLTRFDALTARWVEEREALCDAGLVKKTISPDEYVKRSLCLRASLKSQETVALTLKYPSRGAVVGAVAALEHLEQDVTECREEPIYRTYDERAEDEPARVAREHIAEARGSRYLQGEWAAKAAALAHQTAGASESRGVKIASHVETGWAGTVTQFRAELHTLSELSDGDFKLGDANGEELAGAGYARYGNPSARVALEEIAQRLTKVFGPRHPRTLEVRSDVAYFDRRLGNPALANAELEQVVEDLRSAFPRLHTRTANTYQLLADAERRSNPVVARDLLDQALSIRSELLGAKHPYTVTTLLHLGAVYFERGHHTYALKLFRRALPMVVESFGEVDTAVAGTHENIAAALAAQGHTDLAIEEFRKVLSIFGALPDVDKARVAQTYLQMGDTYNLDSDLGEALAMYRRSLATYREVRRERHPDLVTPLTRIAQVQWLQRDYAGHLATQLQVAAIQRSNYGADHPLTLAAEVNVAWAHQARGEHREARELYERLVGIRSRNTDPRSKAQLNATRLALAYSYLKSGDASRAFETYARMLEAERSSPDSNPLEREKMLIAMGAAYLEIGDRIRAHRAFTQAGEVGKRAGPFNSFLYGQVAVLHWAEQNYQDALTSLQRELNALKRSFPNAESYSTTARIQLGLAYCAVNEPARAVSELERVTTHFANSGWKWSHQNATATAFLGMARSLSGDHARAFRVFDQAFEIHRRTIGIDHPDAVRTYRLLADAQVRSGDAQAAIATLSKALGLRHGSQRISDEDASRIHSALDAIRAGTYRPSAAVETLLF